MDMQQTELALFEGKTNLLVTVAGDARTQQAMLEALALWVVRYSLASGAPSGGCMAWLSV